MLRRAISNTVILLRSVSSKFPARKAIEMLICHSMQLTRLAFSLLARRDEGRLPLGNGLNLREMLRKSAIGFGVT